MYSVSASSSSISGSRFISEIEQAIIKSENPIPFKATEKIKVNGIKGILLNKNEVSKIKNIDQYELNNDPNPQVIRKKPNKKLVYEQEIGVRYLKPPNVPEPGKIIIKQEPDIRAPEAPPLVIRQTRRQKKCKKPIVIREAPPQPPEPIPDKLISIPGKCLCPPPRRIVVEKLPCLPPKPQPVIIEKWLPYKKPEERTVVYEKAPEPAPLPKQKNLVIEWETPDIEINRKIKKLGVIEADPAQYREQYRFNKSFNDLPKLVRKISIKKKPQTRDIQEEHLPKLVGDVEALKLVDLDKEGLGAYKNLL